MMNPGVKNKLYTEIKQTLFEPFKEQNPNSGYDITNSRYKESF